MNSFILASIISFIYIIISFIEMRFIEKENKPIKYLVKDCIIVYCSIILGITIIEQIDPALILEGGEKLSPSSMVFTDNPGF